MSLGEGPAERGDPERADLDERVLTWMREPGFAREPVRFEALALALFRHQFERCAAYRRFCQGRSATPATVRELAAIPAVPTGAFKETRLVSFPGARASHVFRTSGTATSRRGELWLDTLALYEASLLPTFERFVLPDLAPGARIRQLVLAASPAEVPDSSLSHMFGVVMRERGAEGSGFFVSGGKLDATSLLEALEHAGRDAEPVALLGTAFAFVHLLEALGTRRITLGRGSRIMETGGFKGRAREMGQGELYGSLERALGVPAARIVNQYGMTELGSQFYDSVLREPDAPRRKLGPPWATLRVVDPGTGRDGREGIAVAYDLANTGSVLAVQTADRVRRVSDGFQVLGREAGAEERGCSIAADTMLGA